MLLGAPWWGMAYAIFCEDIGGNLERRRQGPLSHDHRSMNAYYHSVKVNQLVCGFHGNQAKHVRGYRETAVDETVLGGKGHRLPVVSITRCCADSKEYIRVGVTAATAVGRLLRCLWVIGQLYQYFDITPLPFKWWIWEDHIFFQVELWLIISNPS